MIKALIIDDEQGACDLLTTLLKDYCPQVHVLDAITDADEAIRKIEMYSPQLLFLDIQMPDKDGFAILENFPNAEFEVIFVTAYDQYILKALRKDAVDYLLKPIDLKDLINAVHRAELEIKTNQNKVNTQKSDEPENTPKVQTIAIANVDGYEFVKIQDIIRIEGDANYTKFYLKEGKTILASKNIGDFESQLPNSIFLRIHHAHIINLNEIQRYVRGRGGHVILSDNSRVDVADRKKDDFLQKIITK